MEKEKKTAKRGATKKGVLQTWENKKAVGSTSGGSRRRGSRGVQKDHKLGDRNVAGKTKAVISGPGLEPVPKPRKKTSKRHKRGGAISSAKKRNDSGDALTSNRW